jgi:hypothetical protein
VREAKAIRLPDITRLDQLELGKRLPAEDLTFESAQEGRDLHGELMLATAVVLVTLSALRVLAAYLLRKHNRKAFKQQLEVVAADGSRRTTTVEYTADSAEAPDAQILKQLAAACHVDLGTLPTA